jgi:hypothetical protein
MRIFRFVLAGVVIVLAASCARVKVETPEGFAEWRTKRVFGQGMYRAVSPEGMQLKARIVKNYPPQSLDFWKEALFSHLENEGYRPAGGAVVFTASGRQGVLYEWAVPYGEEEYVYLTAIVPSQRKIAVVEAAGAFNIYREHRAAILDSLETVSFR